MNVLLWVFQVLLALHTVMGAVWKLSNSEQTVPSLTAIPHGVWLAMSVVELLCSLGLVLPALRKWVPALGGRTARVAPIAAVCIALEMLLFSVLHVSAGDPNTGELIYWLVVAVVCIFIAVGRFVLKPFESST